MKAYGTHGKHGKGRFRVFRRLVGSWRSTRDLHPGHPCGRSGFRDRFLVYAGRAPLKVAPAPGVEPGTSAVRSGACRISVTPCGHTMALSHGVAAPAAVQLLLRASRFMRYRARRCTMTIGLTGRQATLPYERMRMVDSDGNAPSPAGCSALRDSAKSKRCGAETAQPQERQPGRAVFYHYEPLEIGGLCGLCSRDLPLDRRLLFVAELTGQCMMNENGAASG